MMNNNKTTFNNDDTNKNKKTSNIVLPPPIPPPRSLLLDHPHHPQPHPISASTSSEIQQESSYHHQSRHHHPNNDHVDVDDDEDPHDIYNRFVKNQLLMYERAINEIRQGEKRSCWFWFVLPCAPYVVDGIERGSNMNKHFALRSDDAVIAYLNYNNNKSTKKINLRTNYIEILMAIIQQLQYGNTLLNIFGPLDDVKAISSFQLFHRIAKKINDQELEYATNRVLELATTKNKNKKARPMKWGIL